MPTPHAAAADREPFSWLTPDSVTFLERGYLMPGADPVERVRQIADRAEEILRRAAPSDPALDGFADRFFDYMSRGWYTLASPIWANFGLPRSLPISCFGSYVPDSIEGIMDTLSEVAVMTKNGGGTSAYFGAVRPRGSQIRDNGKTSGAVHFMKLFDTAIDTVSQGNTRRGVFAGYLPIEHGDVDEFLEIKSDGNPIQNLFFGVTVSDRFMEEMIAGDPAKRKLWARVLQKRTEIGLPYVLFEGNVSRGRPDVYRDKGMEVLASNVCSEILLPSTEEESFVCDLSSMNLRHFDEWAGTDAVETLTFFLDAVMSEFIEKTLAVRHMERAHRFALRHRALGIGVVGYHTMLQARSVPFGSFEATVLNAEVFRTLKTQAYAASAKLAQIYGEPEVLTGYGRRNTTLLAVAPTTSSAFIGGQVSQSIEPHRSNYYVKDLAKAKVTFKNPELRALLAERGADTDETWDSIRSHDGSVQHLTALLSDHEREVFRTFAEISQLDVVQQAAQRQRYIDQSQSLNLMVHPDTPTKDLNQLHIKAWELGVKTLYYQHSINAAQQFNRELLTGCSSCEG